MYLPPAVIATWALSAVAGVSPSATVGWMLVAFAGASVVYARGVCERLCGRRLAIRRRRHERD